MSIACLAYFASLDVNLLQWRNHCRPRTSCSETQSRQPPYRCKILVFAYPNMRNKLHYHFERTHRFLGWTALALVWAQVVLFINDGRKPDEPLPHACKHNAAFWLQCIIATSIILPWLRLRKVNVRAVTLSKHATRLYFNYSM